jgi:hypothetical protein
MTLLTFVGLAATLIVSSQENARSCSIEQKAEMNRLIVGKWRPHSATGTFCFLYTMARGGTLIYTNTNCPNGIADRAVSGTWKIDDDCKLIMDLGLATKANWAIDFVSDNEFINPGDPKTTYQRE